MTLRRLRLGTRQSRANIRGARKRFRNCLRADSSSRTRVHIAYVQNIKSIGVDQAKYIVGLAWQRQIHDPINNQNGKIIKGKGARLILGAEKFFARR